MKTAVAFVVATIPSLMMLGLLVPFVGPAIDHHYVDRSPNHMHIFVGQATNEHTHFLDSHDHAERLNEDGVSIVTSSAISAYGQLALDGGTLNSSFNYPGQDFLQKHKQELLIPDAEKVALPDKPPRL
ncbi:MAG: hypothetical protein FI735_08130 [SAR202 cluster bacterium]|nr:hypothetical protein [SAR202 cluster bacterium]